MRVEVHRGFERHRAYVVSSFALSPPSEYRLGLLGERLYLLTCLRRQRGNYGPIGNSKQLARGADGKPDFLPEIGTTDRAAGHRRRNVVSVLRRRVGGYGRRLLPSLFQNYDRVERAAIHHGIE